MNIRFLENEMWLDNMDCGDCFEYNDNVFVKTDMVNKDGLIGCVCLNDGKMSWYGFDSVFNVVYCELSVSQDSAFMEGE